MNQGLDLIQILTIIGMPVNTIVIYGLVEYFYNKKKKQKSLRLSLDDSRIRDGAMPKNWKQEIQKNEDMN